MRLKHKVKRKRKIEGFRLDFVTTLTPEECRSRLASKSESASEQLTDGFYLEAHERLPFWLRLEKAGHYDIRLEGTLQAVQDGTWVQGKITSHTERRLRLEQLFLELVMGFFACIFLSWARDVITGEVTTGNPIAEIVTCLLVGAFAVWVLSWRGRLIKAKARKLVSWTREQLAPSPGLAGQPIMDDRDIVDETREGFLDNAVVMALIRAAIFFTVLLFIIGGAQ